GADGAGPEAEAAQTRQIAQPATRGRGINHLGEASSAELGAADRVRSLGRAVRQPAGRLLARGARTTAVAPAKTTRTAVAMLPGKAGEAASSTRPPPCPST